MQFGRLPSGTVTEPLTGPDASAATAPEATEPAASDPRTIVVAAIVFRDAEGRVLTVRKRGTDRFMLPGGKPEAGETPIETAVREVEEELRMRVDAAQLWQLGVFHAAAANEAGHRVTSTVFVHSADPKCLREGLPEPAAEIAEVRWTDPSQEHADIAPLLATQVFPALLAR